MIALSPDGQYLFTPSENANPTETGRRRRQRRHHPADAEGPGHGQKEILADNVDRHRRQPVAARRRHEVVPVRGPDGEACCSPARSSPTGGHLAGRPGHRRLRPPRLARQLRARGHRARQGRQPVPRRRGARRGAIYKAVPERRERPDAGRHALLPRRHRIDPSGWKQVTNPANASARRAPAARSSSTAPRTSTRQTAGCTSRSPSRRATPTRARRQPPGQVVNRGGVYSFSRDGRAGPGDAERRAALQPAHADDRGQRPELRDQAAGPGPAGSAVPRQPRVRRARAPLGARGHPRRHGRVPGERDRRVEAGAQPAGRALRVRAEQGTATRSSRTPTRPARASPAATRPPTCGPRRRGATLRERVHAAASSPRTDRRSTSTSSTATTRHSLRSRSRPERACAD